MGTVFLTLVMVPSLSACGGSGGSSGEDGAAVSSGEGNPTHLLVAYFSLHQYHCPYDCRDRG
ncbi:hypothetical protein CBFG_01831 [Clostridiales bacterium 1_7_47FAA]|nr:hypothetical protein CBFG_01831 [Clostridiales bacterium 1_7_47FAA]